MFINWKDRAKRLIKGVFRYTHTVTTESVVAVVPDFDVEVTMVRADLVSLDIVRNDAVLVTISRNDLVNVDIDRDMVSVL